VVRKALLFAVVCAAVPATAPAATVPDTARACVSSRTPVTRTLRAIAPDLQSASMVLCVNRSGPAPLALRTFVTTACRGEWKASSFAVRYGGGDYTTFGGCVRQKLAAATAALARAQATGSKPCVGTGPLLWHEPSARFGFDVYVVPGRC
jgi:hypothetical protein